MQSSCARRSRMMPMTTSSGTSLPSSTKALAFLPISVPECIASRMMLPVEIVGMPSFLLSTAARVPLPAPGAPSKIIFIMPFLSDEAGTARRYSPPPGFRQSRFACGSIQEALVIPHEHLGLDRLHGVEGHAHENQDGSTAQRDARNVAELADRNGAGSRSRRGTALR